MLCPSPVISIIVSYSRLILIAVYSHLLRESPIAIVSLVRSTIDNVLFLSSRPVVLDQSHQIYWRFLTVGLTLTVWAFELLIGKEEADSFTKDWKVD